MDKKIKTIKVSSCKTCPFLVTQYDPNHTIDTIEECNRLGEIVDIYSSWEDNAVKPNRDLKILEDCPLKSKDLLIILEDGE